MAIFWHEPEKKELLVPSKNFEDFSSVALVGMLRAASDSTSGIADSEVDAVRSVPTGHDKKFPHKYANCFQYKFF